MSVVAEALRAADTSLWVTHGGRHVHEWYLGETCDHIYPTCPALRKHTPMRGRGVLYPEGGDVCGWRLRVWEARNPR